jgi:MFS transporter, DHA1 family, inner membrane transport protein
MTFWAATGLGAVAMTSMALLLPDVGRASATRLANEFRVLTRPRMLLTLALGLLITAGALGTLTYIAPLLRDVTGISPSALPLYLLVYGVGGVIGMQIGGLFADRDLMASIVGVFAANLAVYLLLPSSFVSPIATLVMMFVWGFVGYAIAAPIQVRVVDAGAEAPTLASTLLQSAFNLGNAIGRLAGAAVLGDGFSYSALPLLGATTAAIGVGGALWSVALDRRTAPLIEA